MSALVDDDESLADNEYTHLCMSNKQQVWIYIFLKAEKYINSLDTNDDDDKNK